MGSMKLKGLEVIGCGWEVTDSFPHSFILSFTRAVKYSHRRF